MDRGRYALNKIFVDIFPVLCAYNKGMKKSIISLSLAVVFCFITAVVLCIQALSGAQEVGAFAQGGIKIVLDAGHGGVDGGVSGRTTGVKESDINLDITLCLKERLTDMGFDVTLTRKTEAGLYGVLSKGFKRRDMERRKEIIEEASPELVISIHQNYYPSKTVRGGQVFFRQGDEKSGTFAKALQAQLNTLYGKQGVKARTQKEGEYFIFQCAPCPSVIVECGFLSNEADEALLLSDSWKRKLADHIAVATLSYLANVA